MALLGGSLGSEVDIRLCAGIRPPEVARHRYPRPIAGDGTSRWRAFSSSRLTWQYEAIRWVAMEGMTHLFWLLLAVIVASWWAFYLWGREDG